MGLDGSEKFSPQLQDRMALQLMQQRGASPSGLRNEWQGLNKVPDASIMAGYQAQIAQSGQKLSTSLATTASLTQKAGGGFASQFPAGLQSILSSLTSTPAVGGGGIGGLLSVFTGAYNGSPGRSGGGMGGNPKLPSYASGKGGMATSRGMQVHYHDHAGVQVSQKDGGGLDGDRIDVMIERKTDRRIASVVPQMLRDGYGLKPSLTRRY